MNKLEKEIIKDMYNFETKYTLTQILVKSVLMLGLIITVFLLVGIILNSLYQQQSLSMFEIFFEDLDVIKENLGNVTVTFLQEAPLPEIFITLIIINLIVIEVVKFLLKLERIKNKIAYLFRYWVEKLYEKWKS